MKNISIIVPVYKIEESRLRDCLNSIKNQKDTDIEVIVVDDGSPDDCGKICDEIAKEDERFLVVHTENHGVSAARNVGIKRAAAKHLIFVDGDDQLLPDSISKIKKYPETDLILFDYCINGKNKATTGKSTKFSKKEELAIIQASFLGGANINGMNYTGAPWGKLYKKDIILQNNCYYNESLPRSQDNEFNLRYMNYVSECLYVEEEVYNYTINKNSAMRKYWKKAYENSKVLLDTIAEDLNSVIDLDLCKDAFLRFSFSKLRDVIDTNVYHKDKKISNYMRRCELQKVCETAYFRECIQKKKIENISYDDLLLGTFKMHWYLAASLLIKARRYIKGL